MGAIARALRRVRRGVLRRVVIRRVKGPVRTEVVGRRVVTGVVTRVVKMVIRSARTRKIQTRRRRGMVGRAIKIGTGVVGRKRGKEERKMMEMMEAQTRQTAVARAPTCYLTLFTTSSGASTWPWNRHLRSVSKTSSITETNR